jgi:hypothetical protein
MEHGTRQVTIGKVQICSLDPKTKNTKTPTLPKTRRIGQSTVQNLHSAETHGGGNIQVELIVNRKMRNGGPRRSRVQNQNREIIRQGSGGGVRFDRGKQVGSHGGGIADH